MLNHNKREALQAIVDREKWGRNNSRFLYRIRREFWWLVASLEDAREFADSIGWPLTPEEEANWPKAP